MSSELVEEHRNIQALKNSILAEIQQQTVAAREATEAQVRAAELEQHRIDELLRQNNIEERKTKAIESIIFSVQVISETINGLAELLEIPKTDVQGWFDQHQSFMLRVLEFMGTQIEIQRAILTKLISPDDNAVTEERLRQLLTLLDTLGAGEKRGKEEINITVGPRIGDINSQGDIGISDKGDVTLS